MRTIKVAVNDKSKSVKKILVNRTRSGLLIPMKNGAGSQQGRVFVSPENKNYIGLKNKQAESKIDIKCNIKPE